MTQDLHAELVSNSEDKKIAWDKQRDLKLNGIKVKGLIWKDWILKVVDNTLGPKGTDINKASRKDPTKLNKMLMDNKECHIKH